MQNPSENLILHMCPAQEWEAAQQAGAYRDASLAAGGFIHCSLPEQILNTANRYYTGQSQLVLLWIDLQQLTSEVRWEPAEGERFPHVYGPINLEAVRSVTAFNPDPDGVFRSIK